VIEATLYTDAGCPWAYSANPALRVLEWRFRDQLSWRLVMIGLREDPGHRRLAGPARAGEEVCLPHLVVLDRVPQRPHDGLLPDDLGEVERAVGSVEGGHEPDTSSWVIRHISAEALPQKVVRASLTILARPGARAAPFECCYRRVARSR